MSQSVLANWSISKFGVQITQNAISLVIKKRTDLEYMTDWECFSQKPGRFSTTEDKGRTVNLDGSIINKECFLKWRHHRGYGLGVI